MYISRFQLNDYKSIHKSDEIELTPGVNLIVGKNNAGKTALLEGLGLRFPRNLYRSSKLRRKADSTQRPPTSWAEVSITITRNELWSILRDTPGRFGVPLPEKMAYLTSEGKPEEEHIAHFLSGAFEREEFTFRARYEPDATAAQFLPSQTPCFGAYEVPGVPNNNVPFVFCEISQDDSLVVGARQSGSANMDFGLNVMEVLRQRIYSFTAERFALSKCKIGLRDDLEPDATNLAEVLSNLKDRSPKKVQTVEPLSGPGTP